MPADWCGWKGGRRSGGRTRHRVAEPPRRSPRARSSASRRWRGTASGSCCARSLGGSILSAASGGERPIAFIPEDRTTEGLIPAMTLTENVVLGLLGLGALDPRADGGLARRRGEDGGDCSRLAAPRRAVGAGRVAERRQPAAGRGGPGALQAARRRRRGEPHPGLDIRAAATIHRRLRRAAAEGGGACSTPAISTKCSPWPPASSSRGRVGRAAPGRPGTSWAR